MKSDAERGAESRAAIDMSADEFRAAGHRLVDELADFYGSLPERPIAPGESVHRIQELIKPQSLPETGRAASELLAEIAPLLFDHSAHNGHPRFFGYITSSAAPLGALADLLAAGVNQNCSLRTMSPAANEIEKQAVAWLAELVGFPTSCGGLMVSGGNMANMVAFLAARRARLAGDIRRNGLCESGGRPRVYVSRETHTWIQKATDMSGMGTDSIRWIDTDSEQRMDTNALEQAISEDRAAGEQPFLIVGTAGNVSTGAVDALDEIASVAHEHEMWFHVDGAYGAPAAALPEAPPALKALSAADSIALDPHKWLYNPIEAACTLVRQPDALRDAFAFRPPYYVFGDDKDEGGIDYYELGPQNTRAFRALKVWLCLRQAGRSGYVGRIREDIRLSQYLAERVDADPELEKGSQNLSITTFRFRPSAAKNDADWNRYLDELNARLVSELQQGGEVFVSNAVMKDGQYLRACIVNFRTADADIDALTETVLRVGRELDARMRPAALAD